MAKAAQLAGVSNYSPLDRRRMSLGIDKYYEKEVRITKEWLVGQSSLNFCFDGLKDPA